jgi:hypothetical protein
MQDAMVNYLTQDRPTVNKKTTLDRVAQINRSILALTHMAELHRARTKNSKSPRPTLTEEFFEGVCVI